MLKRWASLAMSTSILKALPSKFDTKDTHLVFYLRASGDFCGLLITSLVLVRQVVLTQIKPEIMLQTVWIQIRSEVILQTV